MQIMISPKKELRNRRLFDGRISKALQNTSVAIIDMVLSLLASSFDPDVACIVFVNVILLIL